MSFYKDFITDFHIYKTKEVSDTSRVCLCGFYHVCSSFWNQSLRHVVYQPKMLKNL